MQIRLLVGHVGDISERVNCTSGSRNRTVEEQFSKHCSEHRPPVASPLLHDTIPSKQHRIKLWTINTPAL